ncbi:MAG TPA: hypothetical protein VK841_05305 [Polyangiaceae bacterium]|jgi:hypothetical protein|nr:hypothetical protein [Polyangiaceae bacterium]
MAKQVLHELSRQILIGFGRIGGRAAASAMKSVLRDGRTIAKQVEDRFSVASERIDEMLGGEGRDRDRDDR